MNDSGLRLSVKVLVLSVAAAAQAPERPRSGEVTASRRVPVLFLNS